MIPISISQLCDQGYLVKFSKDCCVVQNINQGRCGMDYRAGRLHAIESLHLPMSHIVGDVMSLWHHRLGHLSYPRLQTLVSSGSLGNVEFPTTHPPCEHCVLGKGCVLPFSPSERMSKSPFNLIHRDVWTSLIPSLGARF